MKKSQDNITIIGAGLVGSLLSIYLAKEGHKVSLYERRNDMRKANADAGRSINLALSDRGWKALDGVGLGDKIRAMAIPMKGRMMHDLEGRLTFQQYGKENEAIYSVSRGGLNARLMDVAEDNGVEIFFNERCTDVDLDGCIAHFENYETGNISTVMPDVLFGADGAFSALRSAMQRTDRFNFSQHYIEHGYKELHIPATMQDEFALEPNALHIWPRGNYMMIALPNPDRSFTCTLFFPFHGDPSFDTLQTKADVEKFVHENFADALPLMPSLLQDFFRNPTSSLVTVKCHPWVYGDNIALIGDASHAIVPFYGQGMNSGFEDCTVLHRIMKESDGDWGDVLREFSRTRKPDADAISDLALRNFVEMRDLVGDERFLLRKKIESVIHQKYPEKWTPLYSMVTFSHMPYSEALRRGQIQDRIMESLLDKYEKDGKIKDEDMALIADEAVKML